MRQYLVCAMLAVSVSAQAGEVLISTNKEGGKLIATDEIIPSECPGKMLFISTSPLHPTLRGCWNIVYGTVHVIYHDGSEWNYPGDGFVPGDSLKEWMRAHPDGKTVY